MKKLLSSLVGSILALSLSAQIDRSEPPEAAPPEPLEFGDYKVYELKNGLTLIVVKNDKLPRLSASLVVDNRPVLEGDNAGYVSLAGEMLRQGTENLEKDTLDQTIDFLGANLSTGSSSAYISGLSKYDKRLINLLADVVRNPAFPKEEFDKLKKQSLSGIESSKDDPDALSSRLYNSTLYGPQHPYGELETKATIENVELEDCKQFYEKNWAPNRTYLALVGDIGNWRAKRLVKKAFGDWEPQEVEIPQYEKPAKPEERVVNIINRSSSAQTVLKLGNTIDLEPGDEDVVALRLTNQILGGGSLGRLFQNLREDKGFTYGAYSSYDADRLVGDFSASASVRNEVTDSAVTEFLKEFKRLHDEPVADEDLQNAKNYIAGSFGRSMESPQTMARFALNIQRYDLPEDYYESYLQRMEKLTAQDIQAAAQKYIQAEQMNVTAVGKGAEIAPALKKFGPVTYFNFEGDTTDSPSLPLPEDLTASEVIGNYIKAIGGEEALASVKDLKMTMNAEIQGMPANMKAEATVMRKRPNLYSNEVTVSGMGTVNKEVYDGEKGVSTSMKGTQELEGERLANMRLTAMFFIENKYQDLGYELKLSHAEMVDGEKAYALEVTPEKGPSFTEFYSADSGLKLKKVTEIETEEKSVTSIQTFGDYQEVKGVKFPHQQKVLSPQKVTMTLTDIQVNSGLSEDDFQ